MVRIFNVEYNKEEEKIVAVSGLSGALVGLLIGGLLSYWIGFFTNLNLATTDLIEWAVFLIKLGSIMVTMCCVVTFTISILLCRIGNCANSMQARKKMIRGALLFPLIMAYAFLVMGIVFIPLDAFLLQYLSPFLIVSVGALVFFPFAIIFLAVVLPDTPAGKGLRRFIRRLGRGGKKEREH